MELRSYSEVFNLGHKALETLFNDDVKITEKIDGSQFSFGKINGELFCRSHHQNLVLDAAGMFQPAVDYVVSIKDLLIDGCTYRGEFLSKPKHNTLHYSRIPKNYVILFDIDMGEQDYLDYGSLKLTSDFMGLECVQQFPVVKTEGRVSLDSLRKLLEKESMLGGTTIEGVVIKNYSQFGRDKKVLMGKLVSEKFKEMHTREWKRANPTYRDTVEQLGQELRTEARWNKAIQHLKERELLENSPRDIGKLLKEIQADVEKECEEYIKDKLYQYARKFILKKVTAGFPEYYKNFLT